MVPADVRNRGRRPSFSTIAAAATAQRRFQTCRHAEMSVFVDNLLSLIDDQGRVDISTCVMFCDNTSCVLLAVHRREPSRRLRCHEETWESQGRKQDLHERGQTPIPGACIVSGSKCDPCRDETAKVEPTLEAGRCNGSMGGVRDLVDEQRCTAGVPSCSAAKEATGGDEGSGVGCCCLQNGSGDDEDVANVQAHLATVFVLSPGGDEEGDTVKEPVNGVDESEPGILGVVHELVPLGKSL
ncbi:hypothetical protein HG531_002807 [Fusarium graminearum]|nr:hypothetical protein HG531_002807 [Fusarium graminearum]